MRAKKHKIPLLEKYTNKKLSYMPKTITLWYRGEPVYVLCPGKVTTRQFNIAHENEGWTGDPIRKAQLHRGYWKYSRKSKYFRISTRETEGAKLYTYYSWNGERA